MTDNIHTAEEVRAHANCVAAMALPREAEMLRAYAALLERREAGVTDEVVAKAAHAYLGKHVATQGQPAEPIVIPDYWAAVGNDGIEMSMSTDDANAGEAARQEVNDWINDNDPSLRIVGLYRTPPAQSPAAPDDKHERELGELIDERDRREEIIDCLCDAVLGQGRPEWSSAYGYDDALLEVQEAMFAQPAERVPEGWQPIEAAPMDIDLLLWWQADLPMDVGIRTETGFQRANDGMGEYDCEPTYWMPLPAAPQPGEPQDEALADTQRAIIEAAERRGYERGIAESRSVASDEWISVKDRLPKCSSKPDSFGTCVLIYPHHKSEGSSDMPIAFYGRRQTAEPNFYIHGRILNHVTHWMPIPAAPQPGESPQPCNRNCDCVGPCKMGEPS